LNNTGIGEGESEGLEVEESSMTGIICAIRGRLKYNIMVKRWEL
jgi:hypothetical protein